MTIPQETVEMKKIIQENNIRTFDELLEYQEKNAKKRISNKRLIVLTSVITFLTLFILIKSLNLQ
jgi:hypothetical protein